MGCLDLALQILSCALELLISVNEVTVKYDACTLDLMEVSLLASSAAMSSWRDQEAQT